MLKLQLKSTLTAISLFWKLNQKFQKDISAQEYKEIEKWTQRLNECEKLYKNQENKLGCFAEFDEQIKTLKKDMKAKLWKSANISFIFMKSYPISVKQEPLILNLIRKKNYFRSTFKEIF